MRYTEKEYKNPENGEILNQVMEVISAPFILIKEVSMKAPFLKRTVIEKLMLTAIVIAVFIILLQTAVALLLDIFNLYTGNMPLIIQIIALFILIVLYILYEVLDFRIYKHVESIIPCNQENGNNVSKQNKEDSVQGNSSIKQERAVCNREESQSDCNIDMSLLDEKNDLPRLNLEELNNNDEILTESIDLSLLDSDYTEQKFVSSKKVHLDTTNDTIEELSGLDLKTQIDDLMDCGIEYMGTLDVNHITQIECSIKNSVSEEAMYTSEELVQKFDAKEELLEKELENIVRNLDIKIDSSLLA